MNPSLDDIKANMDEMVEVINGLYLKASYTEAIEMEDELESANNLYGYLVTLEEEYPQFINPNSPTLKVGGSEIGRRLTINHLCPILALTRVNSIFDIENKHYHITQMYKDIKGDKLFLNDRPMYHLEYKLKGVVVSLVYMDGKLIHAITRGDGYEGEDIIENIRTVLNVPQQLNSVDDVPNHLIIRGTVVMSKYKYDEVIAKGYNGTRRGIPTVKGILYSGLMSLTPSVTAKLSPAFYPYSIAYASNGEVIDSIKTYDEQLEYLSKIGFDLLETRPVLPISQRHQVSDLTASIQVLLEESENYRYSTEGVVIKINDLEVVQAMSAHEHAGTTAMMVVPNLMER